MALSQLKTICEGLNNTNFEDERGGRRRRGSNKEKLELGTRYADVVVANQRTIPTLKAFSRKVKAPPREQLVQCPTTAMAVFYSNLEGDTYINWWMICIIRTPFHAYTLHSFFTSICHLHSADWQTLVMNLPSKCYCRGKKFIRQHPLFSLSILTSYTCRSIPLL
jgi:hypothetical protein